MVKFDNFSVKIIIGASMKVVVSLFTESQFFLAVIADPNHVKLASIVSLGLCLGNEVCNSFAEEERR